MIGELTNHLWQSTVFAAAVTLFALALKKNRAQVRYWLWFSASLKFFVPLTLLIGLGGYLQRAPVVSQIAAPAISAAMDRVAEPFLGAVYAGPSVETGRDWTIMILIGLWACGFASVALIRFRGWLRIRAALRASASLDLAAFVEVRSSAGLLEPGVVGLFRPVLLLPQGIAERLTAPQMDAVLAHELCHVRRRDNLLSAIHMIVEAVFWFYPLVWWIGARMVEERERACDEEVLRLGGEPEIYAEAILNVCKLYVESPLACVSGVTGADLKKRIEAIMIGRPFTKLNHVRKLALAASGIAALALPVGIGMTKAQTAPRPKFEVASIRPCEGDGGGRKGSSKGGISPGRLIMNCATVESLIDTAYIRFADGRSYKFSRSGPPFQGAPAWIGSEHFQINATTERPQTFAMMRGPMLQTLLEDRFKLKVHRETRESSVYLLTVAKGGPKKMIPTPAGSCAPFDLDHPPDDPKGKPPCGFFRTPAAGEGIDTNGQTMTGLCTQFSTSLDRDVIDKTGIKGMFNIHLEMPQADLFPPRDAEAPPDPALIFGDVQGALKKLGLKLEAAKASSEFLVIDHVERPSSN